MKIALTIAFAALAAQPALATTVLDTSLPLVNGTYGGGTATTVRDANGTVTTVTGPGGGANRASAPTTTNQWLQRNVGGNASVGITKTYPRSGNGSAYFTGTDGASKADLEYYFSTPVALSTFESAAYDWYRSSASTTNGIQTTSLRLATIGAAGGFGYLIFEPYYQGAPANVATDSWQTSTIGLDSQVWNNAGLINPTGNYTNALSAWIAANPGALVYGLSTGIGSGWSGSYSGGVDNIRYSFGRNGSGEFNFEVASAAVPEPGTWAMMIGGLGVVGGVMRRRRRTVAAA